MMDKNMNKKKTLLRDYIILAVSIMTTIVILVIFPNKAGIVTEISKKYFIEIMAILPAIMIMIGMFSVWVSKDLVIKYMGKSSGIKGILLALLFGALPTGPLFIAFSIALALIKKGAKISNIVIFLSAWACIKIPQEMAEIQFLGIKFMLLRLALTIIFSIIMGIIIEKMMDGKKIGSTKSKEA